MEQKGFFCYNSWLKALEPYGDAEKGRIWTTLLEYSNGLAIDGHSSGNERFILPMLLDQIDRDAEKREQFAEKQRENGKKGGRPPKPKETQQNPENPTQAKKAKDKNKNKDNIPPTPLAGGEGVPSRFVPPTPQEVDAYCRERAKRRCVDKIVHRVVCLMCDVGVWIYGKSEILWQCRYAGTKGMGS